MENSTSTVGLRSTDDSALRQRFLIPDISYGDQPVDLFYILARHRGAERVGEWLARYTAGDPPP